MGRSEVPRSGVLLLSIHFAELKRTHTNDARRTLSKEVPAIADRMGPSVRIQPVRFGIIRSVTEGVTRGSGVVWQFGYSGLNQDLLHVLVAELKQLKAKFPWWSSVDLILGQVVAEIE